MDVDVAVAAELFADRTRADVIAALLDGRALTAGELARVTGVSAQTISTHLRRLLDGAIVAVEPQGRHRYYRLASEHAGAAFEALASLSPARPVRSLRQSRISTELRFARTCYDHLAGSVAVQLTEALLREETVIEQGGKYVLSEKGQARLTAFGCDVPDLYRARRSFAHPCLDWSERRHHIAGAVGAALLARMQKLGWASRSPGSRAVRIHHSGIEGIAETFNCSIKAPTH